MVSIREPQLLSVTSVQTNCVTFYPKVAHLLLKHSMVHIVVVSAAGHHTVLLADHLQESRAGLNSRILPVGLLIQSSDCYNVPISQIP